MYPCPTDGDGVEYGYGSWAFAQRKEEALWELSKKIAGGQVRVIVAVPV